MAQDLLKGKRGIIFGALNDKSIAWKVAERCVEQGATITLSNTATALRFGDLNKLAQRYKTEAIAADATNVAELENVFRRSQEVLGGKIDFVLHSVGMSLNVRKKREYQDLDYDFYAKTLDISATSFHKMLQVAYKLDAMNPNGSILALTYIAAQRIFDGYNDMADAKALLESITRSFGYIFGRDRKVRVNTVSQSPTMTTAGEGIKGFGDMLDYAERQSPLGNASADECADFCTLLFSDFARKVTMQNLFHDGGFSSMGLSGPLIQQYAKSFGDRPEEAQQ